MDYIVFLDTNIFLHYELFDQINWLAVLKAKRVTLVLPPIIPRELNKHKDSHKNPRVRKRANLVIKKIMESLSQYGNLIPIRDNTYLQIEDREPWIDFSSNQLSKGIQDDELIACMLSYKEEKPESSIILVTSDTGLNLLGKAKRQNFSVTSLPDKYKIPEEPDPDKEKIQKLNEQINELKQKLPNLSVVFNNRETNIFFSVKKPIEVNIDEINNKIEELRKAYPKFPYHTADEDPQNEEFPDIASHGIGYILKNPNLSTIDPEDIKDYNQKLDEFFDARSRYLIQKIEYENMLGRTFELELLLANNGSVPAKDVDIYFFFPDGFNIFSENDRPEQPDPPNPPTRPQSLYEKLLESTSLKSRFGDFIIPIRSPNVHNTDFKPPNVSPPTIKKTNSYQIKTHVAVLKHKSYIPLHKLFLSFDSNELVKPFHFSYRLLAENYPNEIRGDLHINFHEL